MKNQGKRSCLIPVKLSHLILILSFFLILPLLLFFTFFFLPLLKAQYIHFFFLLKNSPNHKMLMWESWDSSPDKAISKSHTRMGCSLKWTHLLIKLLHAVLFHQPPTNFIPDYCHHSRNYLLFVSDILPGTHFPSTLVEYFSRLDSCKCWCHISPWDIILTKRCLRRLIPNTLANTWR